MICKRVVIKNYRNISEAEVDFCDGLNVLIGNNAQGKTNLIESIYHIALGKPFRFGKESDLIRFGEENARIQLFFESEKRQRTQNISYNLALGKRKTVTLNGVKMTKTADFIGNVRVVLFCPEHLEIVKGGPSVRRDFTDVAISQLRPVYVRDLIEFEKNLKNRNAILSEAQENNTNKIDIDSFSVWSEMVARHSARISYFRESYIKKLCDKVNVIFGEMTDGKERIEIIYSSSISKLLQEGEDHSDMQKTALLYSKRLQENLEKEILAGTTLYGAHRDNIEILINGQNARLFASQGQQRSITLALKLAESEICLEDSGEFPILLLDDVMSELDKKRREYLMNYLRGRQAIITTCEGISGEDQIDSSFPYENANVIFVKNGEYSPFSKIQS